MQQLELIIDGIKLPFSPAVSITEDGEELHVEADFGDKDLWKKTFFAYLPMSEVYKQHNVFQRMYDQLEEKLTKYVKDNFPDLKLDWDMVIYDQVFIRDNNFKMIVTIDK